MITFKGAFLALFTFTFLRVASALAVGSGDVAHINQKRAPEPFPPKEPVKVPLHLIKEGDVVTEMWITVSIAGLDFKVLFDSGSGAIWVISTELKNPAYDGMPKYPLDKSPECDKQDSLQYGSTMLVHGVWIDNQNVLVQDYFRENYRFLAVGEIIDDDNYIARLGLQGIFGAAPAKFTEDKPDPWLVGTRYSLDINGDDDSTFTFGPIQLDESKIIKLMPNVNSWTIHSDELGETLLDSGAVALSLPKAFFDKYIAKQKTTWAPNSKDNDKDYWLVDCNEDLTDMDFDFGDGTAKISGNLLKIPYESQNVEGRCQLWILINDDPNEETTLGAPFFQDNIVSFDGANRQIAVTTK